MPEVRRVHASPKSAVLWIYDPEQEVPQVEPAAGGLVVVVPSGADNLQDIQTFFTQAAKELGLKPKGRPD